MKTEVVSVTTDADLTDQLSPAVDVLNRGGLVAFPTETVYGLAANVAAVGALAALAALKERPVDKPFTLHIGALHYFDRYVPGLSLLDRAFLRKALPGPMTAVFSLSDNQLEQARQRLGDELMAALYHEKTIGIRLPDDRVAQQLLCACNGPVVAPSANRARAHPPTTAQEVLEQLDGKIDMVLDAGPTTYARASTVIKLDGNRMKVLRQGVLDEAVLERMRVVNVLFVCTGNTCRSPMAEGLWAKMLAERLACSVDDLGTLGYNVASAGVMGLSSAPAAAEAVQTCAEYGADISGHQAQVLTDNLVRWADFIFVMSTSHYQAVVDMMPDARNKTQLLAKGASIEDPVGQPLEIYRQCARQIADAITERFDELL